MKDELARIESSILNVCGLKISEITADFECDEYCGLNFKIAERNIKFRKAKITPKKTGQFVTLWKRNSQNKTEPFSENDDLDFCIIVTEQEGKFGFFMFPKVVLIEKQILTTNKKDGKRGFRIYPAWAKTNNKQAEKAQNWQTKYFINLKDIDKNNIEKFKIIFNKNH